MENIAHNETAEALRGLLQIYAESAFGKDEQAHMALYDEEVLIFDAWNKVSVSDRAEWAKEVRNWFAFSGEHRDLVEFANLEILVSGDLATATALVTFSAVDAGGKRLRSMSNRFTWVFRKRGSWKIHHQHSSLPADPATMKAIFE